MQERSEHVAVDETQAKQSLEDCVGELGRLLEEGRGFCGLGCAEAFHLADDIK